MSQAGPPGAFDKLRRFVRTAPPSERCEVCSVALARDHQHLIELASRKPICACDSCAVLFTSHTKYKRVPRRVQFLDNFHLTDSQWDGMLMPINLAFFFHSSPQGRVVAMYPSPAGATESLLPLETWEEISAHNPLLQEMEADVEALLANRIGHSRGFTAPEYYLAPIDECYKLVGLIRGNWQGFSGGTEVWREIGGFFAALRLRSGAATSAIAEIPATPHSTELHA